MPVQACCDTLSNFPLDPEIAWGNGAFQGGLDVFGPGVTREPDTSRLRVGGVVDGYGHGIVMWFKTCATLARFKGVEFTTYGRMDTNPELHFQIWTNSNYPWQAAPQDQRGACTAPDPASAWGYCLATTQAVPFGRTVQVAWTDLQGGQPVAWDPSTSPHEVLAIQWQFPWHAGAAAYGVDVTIDDVRFLGGSGVECAPASGGAGGFGGGTPVAGFGGAGFGGAGFGGAGFGGGGFGGNAATAGTFGAGQGGAGNDG